MYTIKQSPEDFVVKEISNVKIKNSGKYFYSKLTKKNRNTLDVVKQLARILYVKEKQIGFAGNKDKHAVTEQTISFYGVKKDKIIKIINKDWDLEFLGSGSKPISLGDLEGNYFEIVVRDFEDDYVEGISFIENYFDEQRFSKNNVKVGKCLIKKDFKNALKLIDDENCNARLSKKPNDLIGALKLIPLRLLRMYVNAYQSYLWNEIVEKYLRKNNRVCLEVDYSVGTFVFVENPDKFAGLEVPLIGFSDDLIQDNEINEITTSIMEKENISHKDFIIKQIPELTLEGEMRKVVVAVNDFKVLKKGKGWVKLSFSLQKGSYATMVVKRLFG